MGHDMHNRNMFNGNIIEEVLMSDKNDGIQVYP